MVANKSEGLGNVGEFANCIISFCGWDIEPENGEIKITRFLDKTQCKCGNNDVTKIKVESKITNKTVYFCTFCGCELEKEARE